MDFHDDNDRSDSHRSIALLVVLLGVPIFGAGGLLALAVASAYLNAP